MVLDLERQQLVLAWLSARAPNRHCSLCGGGDFAIGPELMVAIPLSRPPEADEQRGPSRTYPMVLVICKGCANMRFFSANTIGIVPAA
jgi:hypothetical protein